MNRSRVRNNENGKDRTIGKVSNRPRRTEDKRPSDTTFLLERDVSKFMPGPLPVLIDAWHSMMKTGRAPEEHDLVHDPRTRGTLGGLRVRRCCSQGARQVREQGLEHRRNPPDPDALRRVSNASGADREAPEAQASARGDSGRMIWQQRSRNERKFRDMRSDF